MGRRSGAELRELTGFLPAEDNLLVDLAPPSRVLVLRAGLLGDTVFATSIINPLRRHYGFQCRIDLVVRAGMGGLFRHDSRINRVFEVKYRRMPVLLSVAKLRVVRASFAEPYDLVVNLESAAFFNALSRAVRARHRFGTPFASADDDRPGEHAVERLRRLYRHFLPPEALEAAVPSLVAPSKVYLPDRRLESESFFVLNPSNSHFRKGDFRSYRSWPLKFWAELIGRLGEQRQETIVLIGSPGEESLLEDLGAQASRIVSLVGRTSLEELLGVLSRAAALVTTDTGPSHVAAALGTPVLAIFGPSDAQRTAPFRSTGRVEVLSAGLPCSPCSLDGRIRSCTWNRCMEDVTPESVVKALSEMMLDEGEHRPQGARA